MNELIALLLTIFPYMNGDNRQCIAERQVQIASQLEETTRMGVPPALMVSVAFLETHLGCDRHEGGNWGAPISPNERHTAGTHVHAARALLTGFERCGSWDGAVLRFRTGLCRTNASYGVNYLRNVQRLTRRLEGTR